VLRDFLLNFELAGGELGVPPLGGPEDELQPAAQVFLGRVDAQPWIVGRRRLAEYNGRHIEDFHGNRNPGL
jgi:hypothetical protein